MNKKILFVVILSGILVGCPSMPPQLGDGFDKKTSVTTCTPYSDTATCVGDKNNPKVIFDLDSFEFIPKCVNAKKGKRITIDLVSSYEIARRSVTLFPKDEANYSWLAGTNDPNNRKIKVKVPRAQANGEYYYGIWTEAKCLDPRVNVTN